MTLRGLFSLPAAWWTVAAVIGVVLCVLAVSNTVYEATSPTSFDYYILLRKFYSVGAFALVGYPAARARRAADADASPLLVGAIVATFSAFVEVLQYVIDPPPEGLMWNAIDVACGFAGGALAEVISRARLRPR